MSFFRTADTSLIELLERHLCHPLQRLIGMTNFRLAQVATGTILATEVLADVLRGKPPDTLSQVFYAYLFYYTVLGYKRAERDAFRRLENGLANPEKNGVMALTFRILVICVTIVLGLIMPVSNIGLMWSIGALAMTFWFYLTACDPLPPTKSKFRVWLESLGQKPSPVGNK